MIADVNSATISYEDSKELATHADAAVRTKLAQRKDVRPEILYFLAEDPDPDVRRAVAENAAAPDLSHVLLAGDADEEVRTGLEPDVLDEVKRVVDQRIDAGEPGFEGQAKAGEAGEDTATPLEIAYDEAKKKQAAGELTLAWVERVLKRDAREPVMAALAVLCDLPVLAVQRAVVARNQKGLVALFWKAELAPEIAVAVQRQLLGIDEDAAIKGDGGGNYTLSEADMEWQLELIGDG